MLDAGDLLKVVEEAGYTGHQIVASTVISPVTAPVGVGQDEDEAWSSARDRTLSDMKTKSFVSLAVGVVMMVLMYPPLPISELTLAPLLLIAATIIQM
jgi:hypothetical protein